MDERLERYQIEGARWLITKNYALLADEPGLGKSAQSITAFDLLKARRLLVLCPAVARLNWVNEFREFSERGDTFWLKSIFSAEDIRSLIGKNIINGGVICSYNLLLEKKVFTWLSSQRWDVLILDEVHYLKNYKAKRTLAVFGGPAKTSTHIWALSGTPMPNHAGELYVILRVFKQYFGTYASFVYKYCITVWDRFRQEDKIIGTKNIPEIRALLAPIKLRRMKKDVIKDCPPILYSTYAVEAGPVDMNRWYPQLDTRMETPEGLAKDIKEQYAAINAVVNISGLGVDGTNSLLGLRKKCILSRRFAGLQKVQAVVELVTAELEAGAYDKKVIFCVHQAVVEDLRERLAKFKPVIIYGGTPARKRNQREKEFRNDPECKLLIGNIEAAGISINLDVAHHVDIVESSWVPSDDAQAIMRLHRYPFHIVNARYFFLPGIWDENIQRAQARKTKEITAVVDPIENPFA